MVPSKLQEPTFLNTYKFMLFKTYIFFSNHLLTLKGPVTTAADCIINIFFHCFSGKIRLDVSSESSASQRIHMKNQALFSSKDKS